MEQKGPKSTYSCSEHHCKQNILFNWKWRGWPDSTCGSEKKMPSGPSARSCRAAAPWSAIGTCWECPPFLKSSPPMLSRLVWGKNTVSGFLHHTTGIGTVCQSNLHLPLGSEMELAESNLFYLIINMKRDSLAGGIMLPWLLHLHLCPLAVTILQLAKGLLVFHYVFPQEVSMSCKKFGQLIQK